MIKRFFFLQLNEKRSNLSEWWILSNKSIDLLLSSKGYTGSNCQYLSTCTSGITCLNGGSCSSTYDRLSRTYYFVCNCPNG